MRSLLILLLALAGPAFAGDVPTVPVTQYTLDNGLTVILSEDHRLPVVALEIRYLVGSAHEVEGRSGFAHLFEHLMFQGSKSFDDEYFKPFEPIGAQVNGTTNTDRTNFYERVPANYLELALWMESDRMSGLLDALTQQKLDNQRDVVKNERRQRYENTPYGMVWKYLASEPHPVGHPYHHTTIGSHKDLEAASLDDVKAFFRTYYGPANAILTLAGDFQEAEARALIERYFGPLAPGQRAEMPKAELPVLTAPKHITSTDDVKLPRIHLAWHSPAMYAEGDAALDVLSSILTDGKTSRLYKPLVYDKKVAKEVSAFQYSRALGSLYVVVVTGAPGQSVESLYTATQEALREALATPPTEDEMTRALNGWKKSFYGQVESVLSKAQMLSNYAHFTGNPDYLATDLARYTQLTGADIYRTAQQWLVPERQVRIDVVPGPQEQEVDE